MFRVELIWPNNNLEYTVNPPFPSKYRSSPFTSPSTWRTAAVEPLLSADGTKFYFKEECKLLFYCFSMCKSNLTYLVLEG